MDKIAIGGNYADGVVDLDASPRDNIDALAEAKGVPVSEVTACILDRPRHGALIEAVREAGAAIQLIGDGDVAGVIATTDPEDTGIDIYMGVGGAPEGVLAAAALRCIGGQMQGRLVTSNAEQKERAKKMGIEDFDRKYTMHEMASGDVMFAATGVTSGSMLSGVKIKGRAIHTDTVVMRSSTGTTRWIKAKHTHLSKFG
jgi:fructose-1,6-bisphosphatase II / sedoheptulose-1,7-bisphosphatase